MEAPSQDGSTHPMAAGKAGSTNPLGKALTGGPDDGSPEAALPHPESAKRAPANTPRTSSPIAR